MMHTLQCGAVTLRTIDVTFALPEDAPGRYAMRTAFLRKHDADNRRVFSVQRQPTSYRELWMLRTN